MPKIKKVKFVPFFFLVLCISLLGLYINSTSLFRLQLAAYSLRHKKSDVAIDLYKSVLRKENITPKSKTLSTKRISEVYTVLTDLLLAKNRTIEAAQTLKEMTGIHPYIKLGQLQALSNSQSYKKFALALLNVHLQPLAGEQFQLLVDREPGDITARYQLALLYQRQNPKEEKACEQFKEIIRLAADLPERLALELKECLGSAYYNVALLSEKNSETKKALEYYTKVLELDSKSRVDAYYRLKLLYENLGDTLNADKIESRLLALEPEYRVNYKFSEDLTLLGFSLNERELELSNGAEVTFFWVVPKKSDTLSCYNNESANYYRIGNRLFEVKRVDNLAPNFGFELDNARKGFPWGWETDYYRATFESHEILVSQKRDNFMMLNNSALMNSSYQTHYLPIDNNEFYLEGGFVNGGDGKAYLGAGWFDQNKDFIQASYCAANISAPDWQYYTRVFSPFEQSKYCRLWLLNYKSSGKVYFDEIIFIKLKLPEVLGRG